MFQKDEVVFKVAQLLKGAVLLLSGSWSCEGKICLNVFGGNGNKWKGVESIYGKISNVIFLQGIY